MSTAKTFAAAKNDFDTAHRNANTTKCIVPVGGKSHVDASIRDTQGKPSEEY